MQSSKTTHYQLADNGYAISGSREIFNRTLYGSHANDDLPEKYFTFAGDAPLFMGAVSDYSKHTACHYSKCGTLMSGLALTPGGKNPHFYSSDIDTSSRWFHQCADIEAIFRNGWMEYRLSQFSPWFPDVKVEIQAFPLLPKNGFLVHYRIKTNQRVIFCAGMGGITGFIGRFEYYEESKRNFTASDCRGNAVECGENRALIKDEQGRTISIGASFPVQTEIGDAAAMQSEPPGMFIGTKAEEGALQTVKISSVINAGETLDGFLVVIQNDRENALEQWLKHDNPVSELKRRIRQKHACIAVNTPNSMLNQTVAPTVLAIDASWHKNTFCHGAHGYHAPYLGWRSWYGPTVVGWHERVAKAIRSHIAEIPDSAPGPEQVWYDGNDRPDLDHEGTQYHQIRNSTGFIPCILGGNDIYNMQEVGMDMLLHHLDWTGDRELAREIFTALTGVLDWEERILDPDGDGLFQNFLNTWISDGHAYNGGGCAQSSFYNYRANSALAKIAADLELPNEKFKQRAAKIFAAVNDKLWLPEKGVFAEYIDTVGNQLLHPEPELSTIYLAIDCGVADMFQAAQMFKYLEKQLRHETTANNGKLFYSSNWYPKKYSTCGLFPAENIHLALVYFQLGLKEPAFELLQGLTDAFFNSRYPGCLNHILVGNGASDIGDLDFSDVTSMYLRLIAEGLYGIRFKMLDDFIEIAPGFPDEWTHANCRLPDASLDYYRNGSEDNFCFYTENGAIKKFKIPLRSTGLESVFLNGEPVEYELKPAIDNCYMVVETGISGRLHLQVNHGGCALPELPSDNLKVVQGNEFVIEFDRGNIMEWRDAAGAFDIPGASGGRIAGKVPEKAGNYTLFILITAGEYSAWKSVVFTVLPTITSLMTPVEKPANPGDFTPLDISAYFNCSTDRIHTLEYRDPRPEGYSIGSRLNGRYAWEWNHHGHNKIEVDDSTLRRCGGIFRTPSGIGFSTPESGGNLACASIWENFHSRLEIPLDGKASELAILMIGSTNAMQSYVVNAEIQVRYQNGDREEVKLVNPLNFDDWLQPALQTENETVYFSNCNHGIVQRIKLDRNRELAAVSVEAVANEIIIGILGISIAR